MLDVPLAINVMIDRVQALALDASNVKCLFRRSEIEQKMGDAELALADLKRAQALEPDNAIVARSLKVTLNPH